MLQKGLKTVVKVACSWPVSGNVELQTSAFLKDGVLNGIFWNWSGLAEGGMAISFGVFLKGAGLNGRKAHALSFSHMPGMEKLFSWCGGSWYRTFELGANSLPLHFWDVNTLGLWPCSPHRQEHLWYQEMWGPPGGLAPTEDGSPLLEERCHTGTRASLGSSLWDSMV